MSMKRPAAASSTEGWHGADRSDSKGVVPDIYVCSWPHLFHRTSLAFAHPACFSEDTYKKLKSAHLTSEAPRVCNVASVCTGLGTEGWALEDVGVLHKHVVCCEIEEILRTHIEHHFEPMYMVKDALSNKFLNTPPPEFKSPIHLLVGGFPCQPFASNGLNQGFDDEAGRGVVIHHIIKWIRKHEPKAFVLENVSGLLYRHKEEFHTILKALTNLKLWNVSWKLINSCDHGVPQDTRDLTRKLGLVSPAGAVGDQRYKLFHEIESEQQRSQHSRFSWTWCCASNFDATPPRTASGCTG